MLSLVLRNFSYRDAFARNIVLLLAVFSTLFQTTGSAQTGTWQPVASTSPHYNAGVMLVLTDGSVICKTTSGGRIAGDGSDDGGNNGSGWDMLTPVNGSYLNGNWSTIAYMDSPRLFFSSQVLPDSRVYVCGGEYGGGGTWGEIYNPISNTWVPAGLGGSIGHPFPQTVSDANSEMLPNGNVLQASVDESGTNLNYLYNPATDVYTAGQNCLRVDNEATWVKLPDNSILFMDNYGETSERYIPSTGNWVNDATSDESLYDPYGKEAGPAFLLPNGKVWFIGSLPNTLYYTPSGTTAPGTWTDGPSIPNSQGAPDAAAAMLPNGHILLTLSPTPTSANHFPAPTAYYEFDYSAGTNGVFTPISSPGDTSIFGDVTNFTTMVMLPDGNVLFANEGEDQYYEYIPGSGPLAAGQPTINNVNDISCDTYQVTGTLFTGISEGASFGDDWQMNTNFPIVRLTSGSNIYYAKTFNWNNIGAVQTGSALDTTNFILPSGLPNGTYSLQVIANGNPSANYTVVINPVPNAGSITGTTLTCPGGTVNLTDGAAGGVWSSSDNSIATVNSAGVVTGVGAGAAFISYSATRACGTAVATDLVNVTNVGPIVGLYTAVCAGNTINLTDATAVGVGTWSSSNNSIATVGSTGVVQTINAGTATITYSLGSSCIATTVITAGNAQLWVNVGNPAFSAGNTESNQLALDGSGTPYMVYLDFSITGSTGIPATLMKFSEGSWTAVGGGGFTSGINGGGLGTSLAIDGSGNPYVTCNTGEAGEIEEVMEYSGGYWNWLPREYSSGETPYITNVGNVTYSSIAIDPSGTPYVAYNSNYYGGAASVVKFTGSTWVSVGTPSFTPSMPYGADNTPIAIDPFGTPYVVFPDNSSDDGYSGRSTVMKYTGTGATGWVTVGSPGFSAGGVNYVSIAIDAGGTPYVAYEDEANGYKITVMKYTGTGTTGWVTVGSPGFGGYPSSTSIAINPISGMPYVAYQQNSATVMRFNGSSWETVGNAGFSAGGASYLTLAIDGGGTPYVGYQDNSAGGKATVMKFETTLLTPVNGTPGVCIGATTALSDAIPFGTWSSTNTAVAKVGTSGIITGVAGGTATISYTVTSECGTASVTAIVTVSPFATPSLSGVIVNEPCNGNSVGSISLDIAGGASPFSYSWNNGASTSSISSLPIGDYSVTVTDNNGCIAVNYDTVTQPNAIGFNPLITNCSAGSAYINPEVYGGTPPYIYNWSTGSTAPYLSSLSAGVYSLTVTDHNGCTATSSFTVTAVSPIAITSSNVSGTSCTESYGAVYIFDVTGGTGSYTYSWSNGSSSSYISDLPAGVYSVTITDSHGCTDTASFSVNSGYMISITGSATNPSGCTTTDGSITTSASGGNSPYYYYWSNGATGENLPSIPVGNYSLTVTDNNGCTAKASYAISGPGAISITGTVTNSTYCEYAVNGSISTSVSGGASPYTYHWSNGSTTPNISGLAGGTYSVKVTDANGCFNTASFKVEAPDSTIINYVNVTNASSCTSNNGSISLETESYIFSDSETVEWGFTYSWSNGSTTEDVSGLSPGVYSVTITDPYGCAVTESYNITGPNPDAIIIAAADTNVTCGSSNGSIGLTVFGDYAPFNYSWSNGATTPYISGLPTGNYSVTVTDQNGCTSIAGPYTINTPDLIAISGNTTTTSSCGSSDGGITLTVGGSGFLPYTYNWSNGATTANLSGIPSGNYSVTVTDANGCSNAASFVVYGPDSVVVSGIATNTSTCGGSDGSITLSVNATDAEYGFYIYWSNGSYNENQTGLSVGIYTVTVTDLYGCSATASFTINGPDAITISGVTTTPTTCGGSDGSVTLNIGGTGVTPYSYNWSDGETTQNVSDLVPGIYSVTVTDNNGCNNSASFIINQTDLITISGITTYDCDYSSGFITLTVGGIGSPFTFNWSDGETDQNPSYISPGIYSVTVTDANGCTDTASFSLNPPNIIFSIASESDISTCGGSDGAITTTISGGTSPYTYMWYGEEGGVGPYFTLPSTTANVSGLSIAGSYLVYATDSTGCFAQTSTWVNQPDPISVSGTATNPSTCGGSDGSIALSVTGDVGPDTYSWSNGTTDGNASSLVAGNYSVTVTDDNGCFSVAYFTVAQPDNIVISGVATGPTCYNGDDGSISLTISGSGFTPYTYSWTNGSSYTSTVASPSGLYAGGYSVTVTDANGCNSTAAYSVYNPQEIVFTANVTNVSTYGGSDGSINGIELSGLEGDWTYSWSNGVAGDYSTWNWNLSGLTAGAYSVTFTNYNGCTATFSFTVSQPGSGGDVSPVFNGGSPQSLNVCENSGATSINSLLAVADPDAGQTETWSVVSAPANGMLSGFNTTASSGGSNITPSGLTYTPNTGYSGPDAFTIQVSDGDGGIATTVVNVTVASIPVINLYSINNPSACNENDGSITIGNLSASTNYTLYYTQNGVQMSAAVTSNSSGQVGLYSLSSSISLTNIYLQTSLGCTTNTLAGPFSVTNPALSPISISNINSPSVCGGSDGSIVVEGLTAGASYTIYYTNNSVSNFASITADASGDATIGSLSSSMAVANIYLQTSLGCTTNTLAGPYSVTNPALSPISISNINSPSVCGGSDGSIVVEGLTAGASYTIYYTNNSVANSASVTADASGYATIGGLSSSMAVANINLQTSLGCTTNTLTGPFSVTNPVLSPISINDINSPSVCGGSDGSIVVEGLTAGGSYTIYYTNNSAANSASVTADASGDATIGGLSSSMAVANIYLQTSLGCTTNTLTGSFSVTNPVLSPISINDINSPSVCGSSDGSIVVEGLTAGASYTIYYTNNSAANSASVTADASGDATIGGLSSSMAVANIYLETSLGCTTNTLAGPYSVTNPALSPISINNINSPSICGSSDGSIVVEGLTAGASYTIYYTNNSVANSASVTADASGDATIGGLSSSMAIANIYLETSLGCTTNTLAGPYSVTNPSLSPISGVNSVCISDAITLSDAVEGGTWTSSSGVTVDVSGDVNGVTAGTATVTYSTGSGCIATKVLSVNSLPNTGSITGNTSVCVGAQTTLNNVITGGVWSSSNTAAAAVSPSGVVTGEASGSATISYALTNSCGTAASTSTMAVNALPDAGIINGITGLCQSATTSLSDGVAGGSWSSGTIAVATVNNSGIVTGISAGTSVISYTTSNTCGNVSATKLVTVNTVTAGTINGLSTVNVGASITLTDALAGGTWSASNTNVTVSGGLVTGATVGTVIISYQLSGSCGTAYATKLITISNSSIAGINGNTNLCAGATTTLTDATPAGTWSMSNLVATVVGSTGVVTASSAYSGTATVTYSVGGAYTTIVITVNSNPKLIQGVTSECAGTTVTLTDATTGGVWTGSGAVTVSGSGTTGTLVAGSVAGAGTVTYTLPTGCSTIAANNVGPNPTPILGNATVCVGGVTILSDATPGVSSWTSSSSTHASAAGGDITGVAVGVATITYTINTGCFTTISINVVSPPVITGNSGPICPTATMSLIGGTGTWSSAAPAVATVGATGIVTGVAGGTAVISFVPAGTSGCAATTVVTVSPAAAITGNATACLGGTTLLQDVSSGGTWSSGAATVASVSAGGVVTGLTNGTAIITYTTAVGCRSTLTVTISGASTAINGNLALCNGSTTTLSDATTGGTWSSASSLATVVSSTGVVTASATLTGTTTISYTNSGCLATVVVTVSAKPTPIEGTTAECPGLTTSLTNVTAGGAWSISGDATISGSGTTATLVAGAAGGTAIVSYTLSNGCAATVTNTIYALPQPIQGNFNLCVGLVNILSDASPVNTWSSSNTTVATCAGGDITGVGAGTATISFRTGALGYCTITQVITVNAMPVVSPISGPATISHTGSPVSISDATAGGIWTSSNTSVIALAGSTSNPIEATALNPSGSSVIAYAVTVAGCTTKVTRTYSASTASHPDNNGTVNISAGSTISFADDVYGGIWSSGNVGIATVDADGMVTGIMPGSTDITHEIAGTDGVLTKNVTSISVVATPANIVLIPNPNNGSFVVKGEVGTHADAPVVLEITDMLGQLVYHADINAENGKLYKNISLSNTLANGMYMMNVYNGTARSTLYFVIER